MSVTGLPCKLSISLNLKPAFVVFAVFFYHFYKSWELRMRGLFKYFAANTAGYIKI